MAEKNRYPFWIARFWHGMQLGDWFGLLARNRFRVHPYRIPMAFAITGFAVFNSTMGTVQNLWYRRKIQATPLEHPPLFILGHWRSGTTHLHELLMHDRRLACPSTYECFAPLHFLVTEWWVTRLFWFLVPSQRPMDNMKVGWQRPQEDEFALCNMGLPTPYLRMAFPNEPPVYLEFLNMQDVDPVLLERWRTGLTQFCQSLTLKHQKRLALKSPPHTGRIGELLKLFPDARFIHLTRHPHSLFASTMKLWKTLDELQGLQISRGKQREEYILNCLELMYQGYHAHRSQLPDDRVVDLKYEDLVAAPLEQLEAIYQRLDLGDFQQVRPSLQAYLEQQKDYQVNQHRDLPDATKRAIWERWQDYICTYGYDQPDVRPAPAADAGAAEPKRSGDAPPDARPPADGP